MSVAVDLFPDGCAPSPGHAAGTFFMTNPQAAEEMAPPLIGEDTGWIPTPAQRAKGVQPITSTNPNGDVAGVPLATRGPVPGWT